MERKTLHLVSILSKIELRILQNLLLPFVPQCPYCERMLTVPVTLKTEVECTPTGHQISNANRNKKLGKDEEFKE